MNSTTRHRATRRQTLRRALQLESLESRQLMAGDVSGTIFEDLNQNGSRDGSESGVAAGWRVFIDTNLNGAFNTGEPTGQTNVDGDYLITGVQAGLRRLSIEIPLGWTPTKPLSQDVTVENGKETKKADFFAFAGGTIKGEVWNDTDGNGNRDTDPTTGQFIDVGLGGWTVFLDLNKSGILDTGEPETKTDSIGAYQFTNVPAGDYEVTEVLPEGWEASKGYDSKQTAGVTALGTVVQDFANFSLVNGSIEGTVWLDTDGDGDRAKDPTTGLPTEPGLKDWVIILDQNFNGVWDTGELSASTDSDGTYRFASVPEGAYNVLEVMPEGAWSISPGFSNPLLVNVLAGEKSNNVDFANFTVLNGGIVGTIWNDLNRDGVRNTNLAGEYLEPGLEAWTVVLDMNRNGTLDVGEPSATTDVNGSYNFADLQIGEYDLIEMVQTGWETAPGFSGDQSVRVYSGATTTAGDFANFNLSTLVAGSIAGTVWNDDNGNGSQDITESGIEGWTVYADLDSSGSYSTGEPQATSGVDGSYLIAGVNPGTVTVRASVAAGWQATAPLTASRTLVLKNGESILGIGFGAKQIHDSAITGVAFADTNKNGVRDAGDGRGDPAGAATAGKLAGAGTAGSDAEAECGLQPRLLGGLQVENLLGIQGEIHLHEGRHVEEPGVAPIGPPQVPIPAQLAHLPPDLRREVEHKALRRIGRGHPLNAATGTPPDDGQRREQKAGHSLASLHHLREESAGHCAQDDRDEGEKLEDAIAPREAGRGQDLGKDPVLGRGEEGAVDTH